MNKISKLSLIALAIMYPSLQASAQQQNSEDKLTDQEIETITVVSRTLNLYRNGESTTGKLAVDPLNSTQMITSLNANLIHDLGARDAKDLYRNIAGVSQFSYAGVTARGFRQEEIYFDGLRGDPYVGFNVPQLFNVERVDFLKGPSGMLYGPGAPGGLFNYITKKPQSEFSANTRIIVGTDNRYGGSAEVTSEVAEAQSIRLGAFYEQQDTYRDNSASEVAIFDAGYAYDFDDARLVLQYTHYKQDLDANRLRGVPADDNGEFLTYPQWNHNEASDFLDLTSDVLQASLVGELSSSLHYDVALRYIDNEQSQNYHEPRALIDSDDNGEIDLVAREFRDQLRAQSQLSFAANFVYETQVLGAEQRTAFGVDIYSGEEDALLGRASASNDFVSRYLNGTSLGSDILPLSLHKPQYGETDPSQYNVKFAPQRTTKQKRNGAYALNELAWEKFTLVAGVRFDQFEDDANGTQFDDDNVSFRIGGIYKLSNDISLYSQWADSYEPQGVSSQDVQAGGPFEPTTGDIIEVGLNAELFDGSTLLKVAGYEIKRQNLLQSTGTDPEQDGVDNLAAIGEITSKGVEIELITDVTPDWVVSFAYAYNDAKITADNGTGGIRNSVGDRFANAPENQLGVWTRYQIPQWNLAFAVGGNYVDEQLSLSGQTLNSYFVADTSIIWEVDNYSVLFRVENVFDKEYAESGFLARTGHFPGDPRNAFLEFSYSW
ncbi:TonB-dependent siderophore receptor [Pseudoalteromonas piscicida]|uniref:TonB-dependent siderophore receptor n=1 Tax=Pseudoalteromonas piscicida TaxID=43662 RepID=A0A2A5JR39_PSEO7|nr:TonB-dependent receptor [Pseudoalteromonas piscicida]PCK31837.1 TonB-dependent siderophore receptor [Pseudoalteromonas piscicida]